jgi:hypothetical protein
MIHVTAVCVSLAYKHQAVLALMLNGLCGALMRRWMLCTGRAGATAVLHMGTLGSSAPGMCCALLTDCVVSSFLLPAMALFCGVVRMARLLGYKQQARLLGLSSMFE